MKNILVTIATLTAASVFIPTAFAENQLNSAEIRDLFTDSSVSAYNNLKDAPVSLYYDSNGEVRGIFSTGKKGLTKWWVKDNDQICLKGKASDLCFIVIETQGVYAKHLIKEGAEPMLGFSMEKFTKGNINDY